MKIINTFISDNETIPEYTLASLYQLRKLNPDTKIEFICSEVEPYESFFKKNNIEVIPQCSVNSSRLETFQELSWLKKWGKPETVYKSPNYFFHRAMERIYYIQARIEQTNYTDVFHCENDVVCYYPLKEIEEYCEDDFMATPASPTTVTMAIAYISNILGINKICDKLNEYLLLGESELLKQNPKVDMINEMVLLNLCRNNFLLTDFPILPSNDSKFVYDPSSYGQYLFGTNNHKNIVGFTSNEHYLGPIIKSHKISIDFKDKKPFVTLFASDFGGVERDIVRPLFNLHIHSKKLWEIIYV